jgi:hypothetical protein
MGRTLPSITRAFLAEQESFVRFRRALRRSDQHALDDLLSLLERPLRVWRLEPEISIPQLRLF